MENHEHEALLAQLSLRKRSRVADAEQAAEDLYDAILDAHRDGMTYDQIGQACGLSRIRVAQVLRRQRNKSRAA